MRLATRWVKTLAVEKIAQSQKQAVEPQWNFGKGKRKRLHGIPLGQVHSISDGYHDEPAVLMGGPVEHAVKDLQGARVQEREKCRR